MFSSTAGREGHLSKLKQVLGAFLNEVASEEFSHAESVHVMDYKLWSHKVACCTQQTNGSDCGVYTCKNMEYLSRGRSPNYEAGHSSVYRNIIKSEILNSCLFNS